MLKIRYFSPGCDFCSYFFTICIAGSSSVPTLPSVAKCRGSWVVGRGRGSWVWFVGVVRGCGCGCG